MSKIKYAYLKEHTWIYRRNYPKDVVVILGVQALKQSLRTGDPKVAKTRAAEVNSKYVETVERARSGASVVLASNPATVPQRASLTAEPEEIWAEASRETVSLLRAAMAGEHVDVSPICFSGSKRKTTTVAELARAYLRKRAGELRPGGYKSVRYSVGLFDSKFGDRPVQSLGRGDGQLFLSLIAVLSRVIGKSESTRGLGLDQLVVFSQRAKNPITVRTQKRIWAQVNHFLDWAVYEGQLNQNPFRTVLFDQRVKPAPYAVLTDEEVTKLLSQTNNEIYNVLLFCLLTGMRSGEAAGLLRDDLVNKGNLGVFAHVRPNSVRELKTEASERLVPLHSVLEELLTRLPKQGQLFPELTVDKVTKRFAELRTKLELDRPGLVFHSTRKWFITQCERTGVPEHFTASLVGHKSARSENKLTYGIYSAGISDEQKRAIVDQVRLPS
ncbi:tyrosine-type recombinase/integrase [Pseudohalocynthiibacter aestuariivivens]|uniref:Tyrosine-type recombinase/integrase n=1 Tax=Pseudohalocynthiibacter aestuariivivens TaxID=1591409 RepID=A0ABV5JFR6_9RHOB|nr:tyrosine-type recombinase/integrase [Pseudohalocynthiibacter aestuariivivens]MBS9718499.1 tyrosine-type recombinase/integrase [Pseudohalocynthiibacter aestuariivivens]